MPHLASTRDTGQLSTSRCTSMVASTPVPTTLTRNFGFAWGVGGWLLTPFLGSIEPDTFSRMRSRVAAGLKTTFASSYTGEVSLAGMLDPLVFRQYSKQATGEKYLVAPNLGEF